jgi:hypothetical protein
VARISIVIVYFCSKLPDGAIYVIPNATKFLGGNSNTSNYKLVAEIPWTNDLEFFEEGYTFNLPFPSIVGVSGRFPTAPRFALPSTAGKVFILDVTSLPSKIYDISGPDPNNCEWYYLQFVVYDVNNDGREDILTVRSRDTVCPPTQIFPPFPLVAEFVAFIQPEDPLQVPWELKVLYNFDNVVNRAAIGFFDFVDIDHAIYGKEGFETPELIFADFSGENLSIYYVDKYKNWIDNDGVMMTVVEEDLGSMYDVIVVDVNGDGYDDIVSTTHTTRPDNGMYVMFLVLSVII